MTDLGSHALEAVVLKTEAARVPPRATVRADAVTAWTTAQAMFVSTRDEVAWMGVLDAVERTSRAVRPRAMRDHSRDHWRDQTPSRGQKRQKPSEEGSCYPPLVSHG